MHFYRYLQREGGDERRLAYFTSTTIATMSSQLLDAIAFLNSIGTPRAWRGRVCDVKPSTKMTMDR